MKLEQPRWRIQHRSPSGRRWWVVGYRRTRAEARRDCRVYQKRNPDDYWRVVDGSLMLRRAP